MMKKIAHELKKLTWSEMDEFARHIEQITIENQEDGNVPDSGSIAGALIDWADEQEPDLITGTDISEARAAC